ncbi:hypothetical protein HDU82_005142 [Entophlyctis luteolus]|nr:hypothetical protein HDU82_005142 [Entophlyctis luteolus]
MCDSKVKIFSPDQVAKAVFPIELANSTSFSSLLASFELDHLIANVPTNNNSANFLDNVAVQIVSTPVPTKQMASSIRAANQVISQRFISKDVPMLDFDMDLPVLAFSPELSVGQLPSHQSSATKRSSQKTSNSNGCCCSVSRKRHVPQPSSDEDCNMRNHAAMKRQRNTEAARKSRARKAAKICGLEQRVQMLEDEKSVLTVRVAVLQNEAITLAKREAELKWRTETLEKQLIESHRALISCL